MTASTFISTTMSSSSTFSSASKAKSPSFQLKKLKVASSICDWTACSRVARSM